MPCLFSYQATPQQWAQPVVLLLSSVGVGLLGAGAGLASALASGLSALAVAVGALAIGALA